MGTDNTIRVRLLNHSYMAIESNASQEQELREHFSFFVPGYRYMPAFKRKVWDGRVKLYNMVTKQMNVGLYHHLRKFCGDRFYPLQIVDNTKYGIPSQTNNVDHQSLIKTMKDWKMPFELRDYQYKAVTHGIENKRCLLLSPTGSGKSFIIYNLMRYVKEKKNVKKTLIIVPTTSLVEQMYKDFEDYGYDVETNCHRIYSGKDKKTDCPIIISTWQSIYKFGVDFFEQFEAIFGDEVHLFKAKSLSTMMDKCVNARYRYGTTGTLDGTETNKLVLEGLFGKVNTVTTTAQLQKDKQLAELDISVLLLRYHNDVCHWMNGKTYQEEIDYIVTNEQRNNFISKLTVDLKGNTLVMFQFVEKHGKVLVELIREAVEEGRKVFYVSGEVDASDREKIRGIVEKENDAIIVASLGTFSTGINIRNLHNIVFGTPSKSQVKVLQSIGRGLRQSDNGQVTKLYDIADDFHVKSHKNFTLKHSAERIRIYTKEGFRYKVYPIDLKGTSIKDSNDVPD
ncbi:DEAD/DEAH box helicase family protein [bacterium]|nr:DEAD/DEAH box helicase family protein [bacterium]